DKLFHRVLDYYSKSQPKLLDRKKAIINEEKKAQANRDMTEVVDIENLGVKVIVGYFNRAGNTFMQKAQ
ncbi:hypothetical protein N9W79_01355, partial [bacterium]|nr:hypothetical protein [bacterium]